MDTGVPSGFMTTSLDNFNTNGFREGQKETVGCDGGEIVMQQIIRKINDDLAIAGQISLEQLPQIVQDGFLSVLNLRSPQEKGFLATEHQTAERLGLHYSNLPLQLEAINNENTNDVLQEIDLLPKPVLVHCDSALRAAGIAFIHIATRQGVSLEQAFTKAQNLGLFSALTA